MSSDLYEAFEAISDNCSPEQLRELSTLQLISLQDQINEILQQRLKALYSGITAMNLLTAPKVAD